MKVLTRAIISFAVSVGPIILLLLARTLGYLPSRKHPHPRIARELKLIRIMIHVYCRGCHSSSPRSVDAPDLCPQCLALWDFTKAHVTRCIFQEKKSVCAKCHVHCFRSDPHYRETIRAVMRYSGPRVLISHPFLTILHFLDALRPAPSIPLRKVCKEMSDSRQNRGLASFKDDLETIEGPLPGSDDDSDATGAGGKIGF
ncbi:putative nitrous oxide-stimulated promoter family protein [Paratrimastix pyriformis]|uniref:Nitrous oxide-stimulated promoter family protein n=1 Tax=Paratrimastix pyriformis TaxID=342808 RepID=A0ABQ8URU4_9EUKA|nr:putative nitrous oxide-stimulated promoter family protein [Paratrimastix pyriformis]